MILEARRVVTFRCSGQLRDKVNNDMLCLEDINMSDEYSKVVVTDIKIPFSQW